MLPSDTYSNSKPSSSSNARKNPLMEKMRENIKRSLFNPPALDESPSLNQITSPESGFNHPESTSSGDINLMSNSPLVGGRANFESMRNRIKGSLFPNPNSDSKNKSRQTDSNAINLSTSGSIDFSRDAIHDINGDQIDSPFKPTLQSMGIQAMAEVKSAEMEITKIKTKKYKENVSKTENSSISHASGKVFREYNLRHSGEEMLQEINEEQDIDIHFLLENEIFEDYYDIEEFIGEGTTGTVRKCIKLGTEKEVFAVKIVHYKGEMENLKLIVKEFKNHKRLNHKNIIKVYEMYVNTYNKRIYTVMELAECREMFDVIHELGSYNEEVASSIFEQILKSIHYLHSQGVCHRDLKPNNILVSDDGKVVKITDFNVSKFIEDKKKKFAGFGDNIKMWTYTGTVAFLAPEVFSDTEYTKSVDMWSAGVVLYTMLCGYQPFQAEYLQDLISLIVEGKFEFHPDPWDKISDKAKDLVKHLLTKDVQTRYDPWKALMHPWISHHGGLSTSSIAETIGNLKKHVRKNAKLSTVPGYRDVYSSPSGRKDRAITYAPPINGHPFNSDAKINEEIEAENKADDNNMFYSQPPVFSKKSHSMIFSKNSSNPGNDPIADNRMPLCFESVPEIIGIQRKDSYDIIINDSKEENTE